MTVCRTGISWHWCMRWGVSIVVWSHFLLHVDSHFLLLLPVHALPTPAISSPLKLNPTHSSDDQIHLNQVHSRSQAADNTIHNSMFKNKINFIQIVLFLKHENKQHLSVQNFMGKLSLELLLLYITTIQPPEHDLNKKYGIDCLRFKTGLFHTCIHLVYEPGQMSVMWSAASRMTGVKSRQWYRIFHLAITPTLALEPMWGWWQCSWSLGSEDSVSAIF